jgi:hypothetical protein
LSQATLSTWPLKRRRLHSQFHAPLTNAHGLVLHQPERGGVALLCSGTGDLIQRVV